MGNAIQPNFSDISTNLTMQLSTQLSTPELEEAHEFVSLDVDLSPEVQRRVQVIQQLMVVSGTKRYAKVQQQVAEDLGISVRSLRLKLKTREGSELAESSVADRPHLGRCIGRRSIRSIVRTTVVNNRRRYLFSLHHGSALGIRSTQRPTRVFSTASWDIAQTIPSDV